MVLFLEKWEKKLAFKVFQIGEVKEKVVHGCRSFQTVRQAAVLAATKGLSTEVSLPCMMGHHPVLVIMLEQDLFPRVKVVTAMDSLQVTFDLSWTLMIHLILLTSLKDKKQENLHLLSLDPQPPQIQGFSSLILVHEEVNLATQSHHTKVQQPQGNHSRQIGELQIMGLSPNKNAVELKPFKSCCPARQTPNILVRLDSLEPFKHPVDKTSLPMDYLHQTSSILLPLTA